MPTPIRFDFYGGSHEMLVPDDVLSREIAEDILKGQSYPIPGPDSTLRPQSVVDLGAHVGEFTIMAAARWPQATIHAFEPNPRVLSLLRQNSRPYANIVIHEQAVDATARRATLFMSSFSSVMD